MTTPFEHNNEDVMMSDEDAFHQFFLAPSVSEEELALVAPTIKVNLIEAMERMEASIRNNVNNQEETDRDDENGKDSSCNEQETEADTSAATAAAFIGGNVRRYQNTLLEMAKRQNIIVYLSTGAGKTLIALLLIQHYHQNVNHDNSNNTQHKQTLFLVSSVALALQQTAVLQANLPPHLHVCTASQMTVSKETQRNKLASAQVIVATHGAMLELLQHYGDLFQMQHFSLLILDECHHCTGNSNYATIMNQFYHKLKERPRVLGLTASPLINVKHNLTNEQLDYKLDQLERLVDARIVALSELDLDGIDDEEDGKNQNEAQIVLQKDVTVASVVYSESHACFQPLPSMSDWVLHKSRTKEFQQIHVLYEDLGPWIVRLYSEKLHAITKLKVFDGESKEEFQRALQYLKSAQAHCQREITNDTRAFGRTDKLLRLEKLLEQQVEERPDAVGVVFVKMRLTAVALHYYFQERLKQTLDPVSDSHANIPHVEVPSVTLCRKSYELQLLCHKMMGKDDDSVDSRFADADDDRDYSYIKDVELDQVWEAVTENEEADDASKYADADNDPFQTVLKGVFPCSTTNKVSSVCVVQVQDNQATAKCGTRTTSKAVPASAVDSIRSDVLVRKESSVLKASYSGRHLTHWQAEMLQTELLEQQWKIQTVLNRLRRGDVNVLFATSVVEEGVDVKACSFVAAFDEIQNMKSFIQMKGRARQEHAKFFVFENDANVGQTIESYQRTELKLHAHLSLRKSLTRLRVPYNIRHWQRCGDRDDDLELHAIEDGFFETRHGMVLADDAKSLLFRYTLSIPMEASVRASRESLQAHMPFFDYVKGQLTLPAHIASTQRVVSLPKNPIYLGLNKRDMEKMLCLMACVRLHKLKLLNDRLLPMSKDFLLGQVIVPISVPASSRGSTSPNEETCQTQKGSQSVEIFIYPILQQSAAFEQFRAALCPQYIDLAIITMESFCPTKLLPAFTIHHSQFATMSCRLGTEKQTTCSVDEFRLIAEFFGIIFTARWKSKSGSFKHGGTSNDAMRILSDYRVGCVDEHGELQFSVMRRTIDESTRTQSERVHAVRQMAGEKGRPRLWRGIDDETRRYIAYHLSDEIARAPLPFCDHSETSTIQTYEDYYRLEKSVSISSSEPLVVAQHLWRFPRRTEFSENDTANVELFDTEDNECNTSFCRGLTTVRLPLCLFEEMPILADPGLLLLSTFLPQFLYTFERHANASSLVNYCSDRLPLLGTVLSSADIGDIVTVLTAKSCSESRTYDKFEWLGDAVLKLAQTVAILGSVRLRGWVNCLHEGQLDDIRSALTENKRLAQVCMAVGLDQFILTQPLSRGRWTPFTLEHTSLDSFCQVEVQRTPDSDQKMLADVVEAILGLAYLQSDYEKVLLIAHEFQATIPWEKVPWEKEVVHKTYFDSDVITTITNLSEYTFESGQFLLREALTHPTQLDPETSSYQRLEWVGDAVLCLAVRDWIYRHQPNLGLGEMVLMESSLVSNETLGFLSHRIGLCGHLRHCDTTLPGRIADYVVTLEADRRGLWCTDPPKCIADVVESVLGAIHVYAGFDKGKRQLYRPSNQLWIFSTPRTNRILTVHSSDTRRRRCMSWLGRGYGLYRRLRANSANNMVIEWYFGQVHHGARLTEKDDDMYQLLNVMGSACFR